jgi:predicted nuclease with TOPRIM domain
LEEELAAAYTEKDEVIFRNENMASEIEALSEQLSISNTELQVLQEEVSALVSFCICLLTSPWFYEFILAMLIVK